MMTSRQDTETPMDLAKDSVLAVAPDVDHPSLGWELGDLAAERRRRLLAAAALSVGFAVWQHLRHQQRVTEVDTDF